MAPEGPQIRYKRQIRKGPFSISYTGYTFLRQTIPKYSSMYYLPRQTIPNTHVFTPSQDKQYQILIYSPLPKTSNTKYSSIHPFPRQTIPNTNLFTPSQDKQYQILIYSPLPKTNNTKYSCIYSLFLAELRLQSQEVVPELVFASYLEGAWKVVHFLIRAN